MGTTDPTHRFSQKMSESTPVTISSTVTSDGLIDLAKLRETLDYIRPAVQADGGDLVLLGTEGGTVNIQMVGACGGCPLSMMTLKAGIERILMDRVPGIEEVVATADAPMLDHDHMSGVELPAL
jgi:Fe-S cluster biogenesis protein NfuA